jgi:hypothetical protein
MLGKLSIAGAVAAMLMIPTARCPPKSGALLTPALPFNVPAQTIFDKPKNAKSNANEYNVPAMGCRRSGDHDQDEETRQCAAVKREGGGGLGAMSESTWLLLDYLARLLHYRCPHGFGGQPL